MVKSRFPTIIKNNLLNFVILIIVVLSVSVLAANIIVKDGEMKVEKDFYINNSNFFVNTSSGKVGIGTTTPSAILEIASNQANADLNLQASGTDKSAILRMYPTGTGVARVVYGTTAGNKLHFYTLKTGVTTDIMTLDGDGNVGIGTTSPTYKFDVGSNARVQGDLIVDGVIDSTDGSLVLNGNVGIGRTPTTRTFEVQGDAGKTVGGNLWESVSDARFKNVQGEIESALSIVSRLKPVTYTWNQIHDEKFGQESGIRYGFIAQELKEVIPEFVSEDNEGYYWYNPSGYEAILTKAIQEQQQQIEEERGEIDELKQKIAELESSS